MEFVPESPLDTNLVEQLVAARWRIQRSWVLETGLIDREMLKQADHVVQDFEVIEDHVRPSVGKQFVRPVLETHIDAAASRSWR